MHRFQSVDVDVKHQNKRTHTHTYSNDYYYHHILIYSCRSHAAKLNAIKRHLTICEISKQKKKKYETMLIIIMFIKIFRLNKHFHLHKNCIFGSSNVITSLM